MTLYRTNIYNENIEEIPVERFDDTHYWRKSYYGKTMQFPRQQYGSTYHATREEAVKCVRERLVEAEFDAMRRLVEAQSKLRDFDRQHPKSGGEA